MQINGETTHVARCVTHQEYCSKYFKRIVRLHKRVVGEEDFLWNWIGLVSSYMKYGDPDTEFVPKLKECTEHKV